MELSFEELREKEVINIYNGKKLGHITDMIFDIAKGIVIGIIVPGDKKLFKKSEDIFISIRQIRRIGDDVILVALNGYSYYEMGGRGKNSAQKEYYKQETIKDSTKFRRNNDGSFIRYRRINNNKLN